MANGRSYTSYFKADSSGFKKGVDDMVKALEKANKELVNNQYRQKTATRSFPTLRRKLKSLKKKRKKGSNSLKKKRNGAKN